MDNATVERIALANQFKLKPQPDGSQALNPYVFEFAQALLKESSDEQYGDGYYDGYLQGCRDGDEGNADRGLSLSEIAQSERPSPSNKTEQIINQFTQQILLVASGYNPLQFKDHADWLTYCIGEAQQRVLMALKAEK